MNSVKSFKNREKRTGERFLPWRAPILLENDVDFELPILTQDLAFAYKL